MDATGKIRTIAGTGAEGYGGDGGPATQAKLLFPRGIALDSHGNLYIADTQNNRIRLLTPEGTISTFAGTGQRGYSGDGGPVQNIGSASSRFSEHNFSKSARRWAKPASLVPVALSIESVYSADIHS